MRQISIILLIFCSVFLSCQKRNCPCCPLKQQLNLNIPSDPATMDPRKGGDVISSLFHFLLFDGLLRLDDDGNLKLALAERVDISPDRKVYTFTLRPAYWSNGTLVTAWDFEKSWKDILDPHFPAMNAHLFYPIKNAEKAKFGLVPVSEVGIKSLSAKVLQVTLEQPTPYFLDLVAFCVFFPVNSEIDHINPEWATKTGSQFICNGPFQLKTWKRNNTIVLEKNPHYFNANRVVLESIQLNLINSEITSLQMFEKGEIDILGQPLLPLPSDAIPALVKKGLLQIAGSPATTFCSFNVDCFPLNNQNIRKALSYAINRREIVTNITQLSEEPACGMIPPVLKKGNGATVFFEDANINLAKKHFAKGLEELKISAAQFPKLKYLYTRSEEHHKIAQAIQYQWRTTLGIDIELDCVDKKIQQHLLKNRCYQMAQAFWMAQYADPFNIFERFKHKENVKNYPNWEHPHFAHLLDLSCDAKNDEERFALLEEAERLFIDEMPIAPIFHWNCAFIKQPYVKSQGTTPIGNGLYERVFIDLEEKKKLLH